MIPIAISENIKKLDLKYEDEHPDALRQISEWRQRIRDLSDAEDFTNLKTTQQITDVIKAKLRDIIRKRALTRGMTMDQIRSYDERWDELKWVLSLFRPRFEEEMEALSKEIEAELMD